MTATTNFQANVYVYFVRNVLICFFSFLSFIYLFIVDLIHFLIHNTNNYNSYFLLYYLML